MRTLILFLLLVLIGFGYLLSEDVKAGQELDQLRQQNSRLIEENTQLRNAMDLATEKLSASEQKVNELTQQNTVQANELRRLQEENASLNHQVEDLQAKMQMLQWARSLWSAFPKALRLAIFLPIVPTSMMATYLWTRNHKRKPGRTNKRQQRTAFVQLAEHEIQKIIQMRRKR